MKKNSVACVIPARLQSQRFPQKILALLGNKPLVEQTWRAAQTTNAFDHVLVAVDAPNVADVVSSFGGQAVLTPTSCQSGTERLLSTLDHTDVAADVWVNWQCDYPFITTGMVRALLTTIHNDFPAIWTLRQEIIDPQELNNQNVVKVVSNHAGQALYFSRSCIPFCKDPAAMASGTYFKHVGIYAFNQQALTLIKKLERTFLEPAEQLEQLRWLYFGLPIYVHTTNEERFGGIDTPQDLINAESLWQ